MVRYIIGVYHITHQIALRRFARVTKKNYHLQALLLAVVLIALPRARCSFPSAVT